jgi:hypothetical protein
MPNLAFAHAKIRNAFDGFHVAIVIAVGVFLVGTAVVLMLSAVDPQMDA